MSALEALEVGNEVRYQRAALRRQARADPETVRTILLAVPACLENVPIVDVVRLGTGARCSQSLIKLGSLACRDGINLMLPLGRASMTTREWVASRLAVGRVGRWPILLVRDREEWP